MRLLTIRFLAAVGLLLSSLGSQPASAQATGEALRSIWLVDDPLGEKYRIESAESTPAAWLEQAGLALQEGDRLLWNGQPLEPDQPLEPTGLTLVLQVRRAVVFSVLDGEESLPLRSSQPTLAGALWEAGRPLRVADRPAVPADESLETGTVQTVARARTLTIESSEERREIFSAAETPGEALAEAGMALQGLDYTRPAESEPLDAAARIQIVRVSEEVILEQTALPYESEIQQDPDVPLDTREVTQPGQFGLEVTSLRARYEDGEEVSRQEEQAWVARQPQTEIVGYGTKPVVQTIDTPDGPLEYYRAVTVYATSYSPCRSGVEQCYSGTASGMPVQRGVIGVTRAWYNQMLGQRLYVPGYGTGVISDIGAGVPGEYWIDLGFSDADFQPWHSYVTVYFLTPVPASVPWILP